jgi:rhodanese-related sulfurtransferase
VRSLKSSTVFYMRLSHTHCTSFAHCTKLTSASLSPLHFSMRRYLLATLTQHHIRPLAVPSFLPNVRCRLYLPVPHPRTISPSFPSRSFASIQQVDGIPTISAQDAQKELSAFDYIVDVREPDEVQHGMIEGAYHIPLGQVVRDMNKPIVQHLKGKQVLVYCRSGKRSAMAVSGQIDRTQSIENVSRLPLL